jgi:hypothetical protein
MTDERVTALVAERDGLRAEVERLRRALEAMTRIADGLSAKAVGEGERAEAAEAKLARVEAVCDEIEVNSVGRAIARPFRAALADAPSEQRAEVEP